MKMLSANVPMWYIYADVDMKGIPRIPSSKLYGSISTFATQ